MAYYKAETLLCHQRSISSKLWFFSGHVWMWELNYKVSWVPKNWCFWTVVLEKTLESPLDSKEIQLVHPKGNQFWIFIGRIDAKAEDAKNWLIGKTLMLGRNESRRRRGWQRMSGWMASLTQWTWVGVNSRNWWWPGRPDMLQLRGSQRVRHDWVTELNWTDFL